MCMLMYSTCAFFVQYIHGHNIMCMDIIYTQAGVVEDMKGLVSRFMSETESREEVVDEAAKIAEEHEDS